MQFDGKAVVITGGATGIGCSTALAFARKGACVMIGDVDDRGALFVVDGGRNAHRFCSKTPEPW
jgi:NAD(P)-dependent dehydrogenase (short-subunit alcohol dehydrogenase family)